MAGAVHEYEFEQYRLESPINQLSQKILRQWARVDRSSYTHQIGQGFEIYDLLRRKKEAGQSLRANVVGYYVKSDTPIVIEPKDLPQPLDQEDKKLLNVNINRYVAGVISHYATFDCADVEAITNASLLTYDSFRRLASVSIEMYFENLYGEKVGKLSYKPASN